MCVRVSLIRSFRGDPILLEDSFYEVHVVLDNFLESGFLVGSLYFENFLFSLLVVDLVLDCFIFRSNLTLKSRKCYNYKFMSLLSTS